MGVQVENFALDAKNEEAKVAMDHDPDLPFVGLAFKLEVRGGVWSGAFEFMFPYALSPSSIEYYPYSHSYSPFPSLIIFQYYCFFLRARVGSVLSTPPNYTNLTKNVSHRRVDTDS